MSYCRPSSNSFRCDVYAYADVDGGYTIHVAAFRRILPDDVKDPIEAFLNSALTSDEAEAETAANAHAAFMERLTACPMVAICTPSAGNTFHAATLTAFRARMVALREEGLRFPDDVFERIDEELAETVA